MDLNFKVWIGIFFYLFKRKWQIGDARTLFNTSWLDVIAADDRASTFAPRDTCRAHTAVSSPGERLLFPGKVCDRDPVGG